MNLEVRDAETGVITDTFTLTRIRRYKVVDHVLHRNKPWPTSDRRPHLAELCEEISKAHPRKSYNQVVMAAKERYLTWSKNRAVR